MDVHAKQDSLDRRDHPPDLIAKNWADSQSNIEALERLDGRIDARVVRGNITDMPVDAIVNAANESLQGGGGVDEAIHNAAGPELRRFCSDLFCPTGQAVMTPGFKLKQRFVVHTVAPYLNEKGETQPELLAKCYVSSLNEAYKKKHVVKSLAFPCLGTGYYGFPALDAARVAIQSMSSWLGDHREWNVSIQFCVFNEIEETIYRKVCRPI
jgi:O-acetyl-ADP-ribose deacetylase (regulator of RNase III)